ADDWTKVSQNLRWMWAHFSNVTIGEWGETVFAFALLPAQFASYFFPPYFIYLLIKRLCFKSAVSFDGSERRRKNSWGAYLLVSGLILAALYSHDRFMLIQASLEIVCGAMIF